MKTGNRELLDRLAAEYVLGTLRHRARRRFERWLLSPQVGALVMAWEDRLAGLESELKAVPPPPTVWRGIENKLKLRRSSAATRWMAIAASLIVVGLIGLYVARLQQTPVAPVLASTERAFIQTDPQTIYWRVEILGDNQEISLHVHKVHDLPEGRAHELWALPEGGAPVSLGLLPHTGDHHRVLNATQRAALSGAKQIAVSLEPTGGSPTGAPTGPVLHVAPLAPA
jgi:anti-sigma-K factor RskA